MVQDRYLPAHPLPPPLPQHSISRPVALGINQRSRRHCATAVTESDSPRQPRQPVLSPGEVLEEEEEEESCGSATTGRLADWQTVSGTEGGCAPADGESIILWGFSPRALSQPSLSAEPDSLLVSRRPGSECETSPRMLTLMPAAGDIQNTAKMPLDDEDDDHKARALPRARGRLFAYADRDGKREQISASPG